MGGGDVGGWVGPGSVVSELGPGGFDFLVEGFGFGDPAGFFEEVGVSGVGFVGAGVSESVGVLIGFHAAFEGGFVGLEVVGGEVLVGDVGGAEVGEASGDDLG